MNQPKSKRKPGFFWQGALILLPVAVMGIIGIVSLRRDRLLAEQEAREEGKALAQQIMRSAERQFPVGDYLTAQSIFFAEMEAPLFPGSSVTNSVDFARSREWTRKWQSIHPKLDFDQLPVASWTANLSGENVLFDYPEPPGPAEWARMLTPGQQALWCQAQEAEFESSNVQAARDAIDKFLATSPPQAAEANAEYLRMHLDGEDLSPTKVAELLQNSWRSKKRELSEAGLPLGQLLCLEVARATPDHAGLPDKFVQAAASAIVGPPSVISQNVVDEVQRAAGRPDTSSGSLSKDLRQLWTLIEATHVVVNDFREQHPVATWTNGVYWFASSGSQFVLLLEKRTLGPLNGVAVTTNYWDVSIVPREAVVETYTDMVKAADYSVPSYMMISLKIGGEEIPMAGAGPAPNENLEDLPLLGEAAGRFVESPDTNSWQFPFDIKVYLARPDLLYAAQRQRTITFGALVVMSAVAALIGFFAARRAWARQLRLNEMKSDFVSSVSHELRAPIASVRLMAEGLERGKIAEPGKQMEYFKFIVQECRRLSSLIENVLDFSRIEQGRKQYELESTDLAALTRQTVKLMEVYAAEKGVELALQTAGEPVPVELDGKALQQALVNLIDNAIKHSPKGESVTVGLEFRNGPEQRVDLWVEDRGEGIPATEHEKIFERFYRVGSELRRETQGVGIGLSIVKHVVEAHGGRVRVRSAPGQGSRFTIELVAGASVNN